MKLCMHVVNTLSPLRRLDDGPCAIKFKSANSEEISSMEQTTGDHMICSNMRQRFGCVSRYPWTAPIPNGVRPCMTDHGNTIKCT
jgi:hypothetical protein